MVKETTRNTIPETVNIRLEGPGVAMSPIWHGSGESEGKGANTLDTCIKWKIPNKGAAGFVGQPMVQGNTFKGILRDIGATIIARQIGGFERLTDYRIYFNGGDSKTVEKGGVTPGDIQAEREFRETNPFVSLFGGMVKQMLAGHLRVGFLIPVTSATQRLVPDMTQEGVIPVASCVDRSMLSRRDNAKSAPCSDYLLPTGKAELDEEVAAILEKKGKSATPSGTDDTDESDDKKRSAEMIRRFETIAAGTPLYHSMDIFSSNKKEVGLLIAILSAFAERPYVGGRSATGYGRVNFTYHLIMNSKRHESAIVISDNEGFQVNSSFLKDCLDEFNTWLSTLTGDSATISRMLSKADKKEKGKKAEERGEE